MKKSIYFFILILALSFFMLSHISKIYASSTGDPCNTQSDCPQGDTCMLTTVCSVSGGCSSYNTCQATSSIATCYACSSQGWCDTYTVNTSNGTGSCRAGYSYDSNNCSSCGGGGGYVSCGSGPPTDTFSLNSQCLVTITHLEYTNGVPDTGNRTYDGGWNFTNPTPYPAPVNSLGNRNVLVRSTDSCQDQADNVGCNTWQWCSNQPNNCQNVWNNDPYAVMNFNNNWSLPNASTLGITTSIDLDTNDQGQTGQKHAGYEIDVSPFVSGASCTINDCSTTQIYQNTALTTQPWHGDQQACSFTWQTPETHNFSLHYCGNGICECGEQGSNPSGANYCPQDCPTAPPSPTSVTAAQACPTSTVNVNWSASTGATYYQVSRSPGGLLNGSVSGSPYQDTTTTVNSTYTYSVAACNTVGCSAPSANSNSVTIASSSMSAPTGLSSTPQPPVAGNNTFNWNAVIGATAYIFTITDVTYGTGTPQSYTTGSSPSYVYSLSPGHTYNWYVQAENSCGVTSSPSTVVTGLLVPTSIKGFVFNDLDKDYAPYNGATDSIFSATPPASNAPSSSVSLYNSSGVLEQTQPVGADGTFYFNNLTAGKHLISYPNPSGWTVTYGLTYICTGTSSDCPSPAEPPGDGTLNSTTGDVTGVNIGISNSFPWFRGVGADMRINGSFNDLIPSSAVNGPYALLPGSGGTPGVFITDGVSSFGNNGGQPSASSWDWLVTGQPFMGKDLTPTSGYEYVTSNLSSSTSKPLIGGLCASGDGTSGTPCKASISTSGYYNITTGDLYMGNSNFTGGNTVIAVSGNLYITGTISTNTNIGASLLFAVKGNIYVDSSVGENPSNPSCSKSGGVPSYCDLQGEFVTDSTFDIQTASPSCASGSYDNKLSILGSVVANSIVNERDLCAKDLNYPTYTITEDPDALLNAPAALKESNNLWQEVAP